LFFSILLEKKKSSAAKECCQVQKKDLVCVDIFDSVELAWCSLLSETEQKR